MNTLGLDVVWLLKVLPVGARFEGNFDLYLPSLAGGTYSFGMRL